MNEWTKFDNNNPATWPSDMQVVMIAWLEGCEWNNAICKTYLVNIELGLRCFLESIGIEGEEYIQDWDFGWVQKVYWKPHDIQHP